MSSFTEIKYPNAEKELKELLKAAGVQAGYFQNALSVEGDSMAEIAAINELGGVTDEGNHVPPRPFMSRAAKESEKEVIALFQKEAKKQGYNSANVMKKIGLLIIGLIKKQIQISKSWAKENAPLTIELKGSDQPLVDDGTLLKSADYKVKTK